ncbi:hypothetical protein DFH08DRAFT_74267 [Mycena albidolilacea]|uniref:Uncharacterized protein n=1 Tax=Mycena albidolilacea TaxID=1033008 RepID=A0AAD6Z080_9AGAR|nr:hypothetical protein DFH08DRAFT_74267 [Mycena albidolilacea]
MAPESPLNPGGPARKRSSLLRFSFWIGLTRGLFFIKFLVGIGQQLFWFKNFSHSQVYQNQTLAEVKNRTAVVRPLIDENQLFDIAVSIWTLSVDQREDERNDGDVAETPLYSDIVFRGVRLADKHLTHTLNYSLPTAVFRRLLLKENDLRASFVALPTSPSLVDHVTDFSSWRPDTIRIPPVRSWPFPLGASDAGPQTVADRSVDSFGISMPLLEFHEYRSKCAKGGGSDNSGKQDDNDDDDVDDWTDYGDDKFPGRWNPGISDIANNPQHAVKRHPFILTRTHIRVVDETHIFNRKAYNRKHKKLKAVSCGQGHNSKPDHSLCSRTYLENGNFETRLELQIPDEQTGDLRTEWAYAPYIGSSGFSAGPKDVIPIPMTRQKCAESEDPSATDPDSIDIHWQLSYSGRSPGKFVSAELWSFPKRVPHHDSEYKKAKEHDSAEVWNGFHGHRFYEDAHPRRRLIIWILSAISSFILGALDLGYWYTRTSTVFISVSGTVLVALSGIIAAVTHIANTVETEKSDFSTWSWLWLIVFTVATKFSLPFLMLKTVTRVEFSLNESTSIPSVRLVGPNHRERNSQRLDSRTSWGVKAGVCISLIGIFYLFSPDEYHILSAHLPAPSPDDLPTNSIAGLYASVFFPLQLTGRLSQLLLNHRSRTFAGSYKAAVLLRSILSMLHLALYWPALVGRYDARFGLSAPQVVEMIVLAVTIWQAAAFPKAIQKAEDEGSE